MRIVIDLQGAQSSANRLRGIGRYSLSLAKAIVRNRREHDIFIALNGLFPDTIESVRAAFDGLLPQENIRVWYALEPVYANDSMNDKRRLAAEKIREAFLLSLNPDIVLVSSLFEGLSDNIITSICNFDNSTNTAVILYDLIPYIYKNIYLNNSIIKNWYESKIKHLRRSGLLLSISESSRMEGIRYLGLSPETIVNISCAADAFFTTCCLSQSEKDELFREYCLHKPFVMYTGGIDYRKNIEGLIRSYALLPAGIRNSHQLAIVCSVSTSARQELAGFIAEQGMNREEVILTGYVPDGHLRALYNLCKLFIFPSIHEGFGLPALEAMRCGAPVIAANTSSLPEILGRDDALFDPHSDDSIALKLKQALTDDVFRGDLARHGLEQGEKFSWDVSATRAIEAFERVVVSKKSVSIIRKSSIRRPRLAYVSPLPPERTGIADYCAELLPELSRFYDITVVVDQENVSDPWVRSNCEIQKPDWLRSNAEKVERVLYHFGNSAFHQHMFSLLEDVPGCVVMHDFFLSGVQNYREMRGLSPYAWTNELYHSHGYHVVRERFHAVNISDIIWNYPANWSIFQHAKGIISHSECSKRMAQQWYGNNVSKDWKIIPHLRVPFYNSDRTESRKLLSISSKDYILCSFGLLGPTKLNHRLVESWCSSRLARDEHCRLVFVGECPIGEYGDSLKAVMRAKNCRNITITGWVDRDLFRKWLSAADAAVQLRTNSRGETSGTVLDCMNYTLPVIVNQNGSMADLSGDAVWKLPDEFDNGQLVEAMERMWQDPTLRQSLGEKARAEILENHNPHSCAEKYYQAIENFYSLSQSSVRSLVRSIVEIPQYAPDSKEKVDLSESIALNFPLLQPAKQIFVDISELVQRDVGSGIQRVTRSLLMQLLENPPAGYRIEPVYATNSRPGYYYARVFTSNFLGCPVDWATDERIEWSNGDVFLGLDLQPEIVPYQVEFLNCLHRYGVKTFFVVYDLLPVLHAEMFPPGADVPFGKWLRAICAFDGAVCISKSVAEELRNWRNKEINESVMPFKIGWFHLGADIEESVPSRGLPDDADSLLNKISAGSSFLMVGTIEPRKAHSQVLAAFEELWHREDLGVNLIIVGKQGWMVEKLIDTIRTHKELGKRLFWLEGVSDEYLVKIYASCSALIAASIAEGFGLPLIEAARHKIPIIARDIPVFREVAGEHAFYFSDLEPEKIADAIYKWINLHDEGKIPCSERIKWKTWSESSKDLLECILT